MALWIGLLIAGLWPFDFFASNQVSWLRDRHGVHFERYGEIYSPASWVIHPEESFTLELWLASEHRYNAFVPILSIDNSRNSQNFLVEQFRSNLIVEGLFRDGQGRSISERLWMDDALQGGRPRFLTVTSGPGGVAVYLEGVLQRDYPGLKFVSASLVGRLLLGHPVSGHQAWSGDVFGLAYYGKALSAQEISGDYQAWQQAKTAGLVSPGKDAGIYPFDEGEGENIHDETETMPELLVPKHFRVLHRAVLEFPAKPTRSDFFDGIENILGFVPFGLLFTMYFQWGRGYSRSRAMLAAIVLGGTTSLIIELLQIYLPTRDSSLLDLINNILGSALGAIIPYGFIFRRFSRGAASSV